MFAISLFGCILCCKAPALCLFSIVSADVLDFAAVPYLSSNVPFPTHEFEWMFHFDAHDDSITASSLYVT
jgi:hypothetical protein